MRPDLAKVICEKERKGDRSYMGGTKGYDKDYQYRNAEDREDYGDLEALPKHEGMTRRLRAYGTRNFSENLGAIRGLIHKHVGKNWDKLYSAICAQVSPTGTNIERHVHQHLEDFIFIQTRMGERGVEVHAFRTWEPLSTYGGWRRADYYVHPVSRCIVRIKHTKKRPSQRKSQTVMLPVDEMHQLHLIDRVWWLVALEPIPTHCYRHESTRAEFTDTKTVFYCERDYVELPARDILVPDLKLGQYLEEDLARRYGRKGVYGARKSGANHKTLKQHGLAA